ncbi:TetR/AcrR family transcriptional regulator [soil metagenome]
MPTPEKTSREAIVAAGRDLIERDGVVGLTMQAVADRVGVRAPSLYKRVRDRNELLGLVVAASIGDLTARMSAQQQPQPRDRLVALGSVLREFAHEYPVGYSLVFGAHGAPRPELSAAQATVAPVLTAVEELTGPEHALDGARLLTAWATGFLTMELADRLQMGGDIESAWAWGLQRIVGAIER